MKAITSRDNPLYKELKRLAGSSQARRKAGHTLLDGVHLCEAYLQHVSMPLLCAVSDAAIAMPEVAAIVARCEAGKVSCIQLLEPLYNAISTVENGVGILFLIDVPQLPVPTQLTQDAVLLDQVQDPGNLGSILRSAAAAGIKEVCCSPGTALAWSPRVLRAGMGAHFVLKIVENVDLSALLQASRLPVYATSSHTTHTLYQADLTQPLAWLFGNEGQGVSETLMVKATQTVAIPHRGEMESLNVAASAAVCLFEMVRQRENRGR